MKSVKHTLANLIPRSLTLYIKYLYQVLYRVRTKKRKVEAKSKIGSVRKKHCHTFFGYYDVCPFNKKSDEIIYLRLENKKNVAQVILSHLGSHEEELIALTNAWNWQQGSRLRWVPGDERTLCFNDYINNRYCCRFINVDSRKERIVDAPLYDISPDGKWGLSIDFERLQTKRPGYGYLCNPYIENPQELKGEGIDLIDLQNNKSRRIITYQQIAELPGCESDNLRCNYLNHISFSPSGNKFLFFWLFERKGAHFAKLIVFDLLKETFAVLETEERVSHYVWVDDDNIICTTYYGPADCHYCRYNVTNKSKELLCEGILNRDGHPSMFSDEEIITDTYPDIYGYQKLYLVDLNKEQKKEIVSIYSDCRVEGEKRTDLHPRLNFNKNIVCFDANDSGYRSLCFVYL